MKKIKIIDLVESPVLLSPDKGQILLNEVKKYIKKSEKVTIDFTGYKFFSSSFLNNSFGQLCMDMNMSEKEFFNTFSFSGLSEDDLDEIKLSVHNAQTRRKLLKENVNVDEFYKNLMPA